jgi:eukaryotic-like serine/threonine-protein kinase
MVLSWTTRSAQWNGQQDLMNRVFKSFHPRGGE